MEKEQIMKDNSSMTAYIAGKITGEKNYIRKFRKVERQLRKAGYKKILNPCVLPKNLTHDQYILICFGMINASNDVFLMDNWRDSKGASMEKSYAEAKGKRIIYL